MIERIKNLFPWYRDLRALQSEYVTLDKQCARILRERDDKARKLDDADAQVHELSKANRELINRAKRYREQLRENGIEPRIETTRGPEEPARLGTSRPMPLPQGMMEINAKSLRIERRRKASK